MPYGLSTSNQNDERESLLKILKDASPNTDNYFVSNLGVAPAATNVIHGWGTYNTARPTTVTNVIEGSDPTYADLTTPTQSTNYTAIVSEPVKVSGTVEAVNNITGEDPVAFQKGQALMRLKAKMEFLTINGVIAAGSSGVARGMAGMDGCISTLFTLRASGQSFTEVELNDIIQDSWTQVGKEYVADTLVCPMVISRRISGFTSNMTRNADASDKKLQAQITQYYSQVGQLVSIVPHKDMRSGAGTLTVMAVREELFKHSFLQGREPKWQELAKTGDSVSGQYITEFTLVSYAQIASVVRRGYGITL